MAGKKNFLLRLSPEVWEDLASWAQADFRSVNSQIEFLLREAIRQRKRELKKDGEKDSD